jgi:hypothetical protein
MKNKIKIVTGIATLSASALVLMAQGVGNHQRPPHGEGAGGPGGPDGPGHRPPPPIIAALDANRDGAIDAAEIANASAALLTLDANGDGQLTREELRPPRPEGGAGGPPEGAPGTN